MTDTEVLKNITEVSVITDISENCESSIRTKDQKPNDSRKFQLLKFQPCMSLTPQAVAIEACISLYSLLASVISSISHS
jgi:hypothetical protein